MASVAVTWQEIESRLTEVPQEEWPSLLDFLDYLIFKREKAQQSEDHVAEQQTPYRVTVKLGGILKDYPITEEDIAAARKEMWAGFGDIEL